MKKAVLRFLSAAAIALSIGSVPASAQDQVKEKLDSCVTYYENGEYQKAADSIKALLPLISVKQDEATAYKYLGFSYVMLEMIEKAKEFFRVALDKFPQMVVDTLEVPPNITIVFRQVKLEKKIQQGEIIDRSVEKKSVTRNVTAAFLMAGGVIFAGAGGYYLYDAGKRYNAYKAVDVADQERLDLYYKTSQNSLVTGAVSCGIGCVLVPVATYLFAKTGHPVKNVSIRSGIGTMEIVWTF